MTNLVARGTAWFFTTFAILMGIGLVAPVALGMALSGSGQTTKDLYVFGASVFNTSVDSSGGFEAGYGPGLFMMAAVGGLLIGGIAAVSAWLGPDGSRGAANAGNREHG